MKKIKAFTITCALAFIVFVVLACTTTDKYFRAGYAEWAGVTLMLAIVGWAMSKEEKEGMR